MASSKGLNEVVIDCYVGGPNATIFTVPPQKSPRTPLFTPKPILFINFSHTTQLTEFCVIDILTVFLYTISYSRFEFLKYIRELLR